MRCAPHALHARAAACAQLWRAHSCGAMTAAVRAVSCALQAAAAAPAALVARAAVATAAVAMETVGQDTAPS